MKSVFSIAIASAKCSIIVCEVIGCGCCLIAFTSEEVSAFFHNSNVNYGIVLQSFP